MSNLLQMTVFEQAGLQVSTTFTDGHLEDESHRLSDWQLQADFDIADDHYSQRVSSLLHELGISLAISTQKTSQAGCKSFSCRLQRG